MLYQPKEKYDAIKVTGFIVSEDGSCVTGKTTETPDWFTEKWNAGDIKIVFDNRVVEYRYEIDELLIAYEGDYIIRDMNTGHLSGRTAEVFEKLNEPVPEESNTSMVDLSHVRMAFNELRSISFMAQGFIHAHDPWFANELGQQQKLFEQFLAGEVIETDDH